MKIKIEAWDALFAILVVFLIFSFWYSRSHILSYDEYRDLHLADSLTHGAYSYYGEAYYKHPPLYMIFLSLSSSFFGRGEDSGYIVSIFFSILTLYVTYLLVSKNGNKRTALAASVILGLNLWFARNARDLGFEMGTTFFFVLSIYFFHSYLRKRKRGSLITSGIAIGLGLLTKSFIFFLFPTFLLILYLSKNKAESSPPKILRTLLVLIVISFIVYSPWLFYTSLNKGPSQLTAQIEEFTGKLSWAPEYIPPPFYFYLLELPNIMTWTVLALAILGALAFYKTDNPLIKVMISWVVVHIILVSTFGWKEGRFITYTIPGFAILAAFGSEWLSNKIKKPKVLWVIVFLSIIPSLIFTPYPIWGSGETLKSWNLWSDMKALVDKNDYVLTNNYGMADLYSNPSDYLIKDWKFDKIRFLSFDSKFTLIEPDVTYPKENPEIFKKINQYSFDSKNRQSDIVLYEVDLDKLARQVYGDSYKKLRGKITSVTNGIPVSRAHLLIFDPKTKQNIGSFNSKLNGDFSIYLPGYGLYGVLLSAFGYQEKQMAIQFDESGLVICEGQNNCFKKDNFNISLQFKSFLIHEYQGSRF